MLQQKFTGVWVLAIAALILVGCDEETTQPTTDTGTSDTTETVIESIQPSVYWIEEKGDRLEFVAVPIIPTKDNERGILRKLLIELTGGPPEGEYTSALPANTKILSHDIQTKGIVINLSTEFTSGGGSTSMISRLGQVLYTATSIDPKADVWLEVEGQPLELLGGEGLEIAQPMTRTIFESEFQL